MQGVAAFFTYPTVKTWIVGAAIPSVAAANFTSTINLGGVIVGVLVLAFGLLFTLRSNVAKVYKETAEAAAARLEQVERERDEQRELKHAARAEVAALKLKTDQTIVLKQMAADQRELIAALAENQRVGLEAASKLLTATEGRLLDQITSIARSQADLAVIVERVSGRLDKLEATDPA